MKTKHEIAKWVREQSAMKKFVCFSTVGLVSIAIVLVLWRWQHTCSMVQISESSYQWVLHHPPYPEAMQCAYVSKTASQGWILIDSLPNDGGTIILNNLTEEEAKRKGDELCPTFWTMRLDFQSRKESQNGNDDESSPKIYKVELNEGDFARAKDQLSCMDSATALGAEVDALNIGNSKEFNVIERYHKVADLFFGNRVRLIKHNDFDAMVQLDDGRECWIHGSALYLTKESPGDPPATPLVK